MGDTTFPRSSNDADLANDETFGDIGDIRAGDVASELLWAADHNMLAKKVEAEKEAILRARQTKQANPQRVPASSVSSPLERQHPSANVPLVRSPPLAGPVGAYPLYARAEPHIHPTVLQRPPNRHPAAVRSPPQMAPASQQSIGMAPAPQRVPFPAELRPQLEALVRFQQQQFVNRNSALPQDQLRQLLAQYHGHFVNAALSRLSTQLPPFPSAVRNPNQAPGNVIPNKIPGMSNVPSTALSVAELESGMRSARISPEPPAPARQLPTMTDKDLELVLRMHLRQLETSIPHRHDFYNFAFRLRSSSSEEAMPFDLYDQLGANLSARVSASSIAGTKPMKERPTRKKRERTNRKSSVPSRNATSKNSNLKALTNVLGTVQRWNPNSKRRVMEVQVPNGGNEKFDARPLSNVFGDSLNGERQLLRDDERIQVRTAVEDGYDIMGQLEDLVHGHATHDARKLLGKLVGTLRLAQSNGRAQENDAFSSFESMRFFVRMCMFEKGKRYISHVLAVLPADLASRVLLVIFENLSMLLYAVNPMAEVDTQDVLWSAIISTLQKSDFPPEHCLNMLCAFSKAHSSDSGSLIIALSSSVGAKLLYTAMQRVFTARNEESLDASEADNAELDTLVDALTARLGDAFDTAESNENIWQVAAMLDALSDGTTQEFLRGALKELLDSGRAPPPPEA